MKMCLRVWLLHDIVRLRRLIVVRYLFSYTYNVECHLKRRMVMTCVELQKKKEIYQQELQKNYLKLWDTFMPK